MVATAYDAILILDISGFLLSTIAKNEQPRTTNSPVVTAHQGRTAMKKAPALSAAAVALLFTTVSAHAAVAFSDTLEVVVGGTTHTLPLPEESGAIESGTFMDVPTTLTSLPSTATETIFLTDPGTTDISDIVSATLHNAALAPGIQLDLTLTSDDESSLGSVPPGATSLDETGAAQDLTSTFNGLFDFSTGTSLPTIQVTSDADAVPEPSTWAMMLLGFAGLGFASMRKGRRDARLAA
jgi:hypothetical protein